MNKTAIYNTYSNADNQTKKKIWEKKEFDYVIVGAGPSAMGLLLGLLEPCRGTTHECPFSVAILERGPALMSNDDERIKRPSRWFEASHDASSPHVTLLQSHIKSSCSSRRRRIDVPVGSGVGGGSNINACLCMAPSPDDFDQWPEPWTNSSNSSTSSSTSNRQNQHPSIIMASVRHIQECLSQNQCLLDATTGSVCNDFLTAKPDCVPCVATRKSTKQVVERVNYYQGLIQPLFNDYPHLQNHVHWFCNAGAQRLLFREGTNQITGVEILQSGQSSPGHSYETIRARKEVILCTGALETPALLLVSGIGPTTGVSGVGRNLRDHVILPRVVLSPLSPFATCSGVHKAAPFQSHNNTKPKHKFLLLTSTTTPEIALHFFTRILHSFWQSLAPNMMARAFPWKMVEVLVRGFVFYTPLYYIMKYGLTTMNLSLVNPQSTGRIALKCHPNEQGSSFDGFILRRKDVSLDIDPGYLTHPMDLEAFREGWLASPVVSPQPFSKWYSIDIFPNILVRKLYQWFGQPSMHNRDWFSLFSRDVCVPFFHWCGTCAMRSKGNRTEHDATWVVDSDLKVRLFQNLRVCDASVFPDNLSVPPALTCAALGHAFGTNLLLKEY